MSGQEHLTLCILGCGENDRVYWGVGAALTMVGNLGRAILSQLVGWQDSPFSQLIALVKSEASRKQLVEQFGEQVSVRLGDGAVAAARQSDVTILGVDPSDVTAVLQQQGLCDALAGRLLISIAAGWPADKVEQVLYEGSTSEAPRAYILRALPNIAASVSQSLTALAVPPSAPPPPKNIALAELIFSRVGKTAQVPPALMDATTAVAGSTPAMFAILCDALVDASVAVGMPRRTAETMIFQSMKGSAELLLGGLSCGALRDAGTCPEGCTMAAIMTMEERGVRGAVGRALREAVTAARQMENVRHVNDTWGQS